MNINLFWKRFLDLNFGRDYLHFSFKYLSLTRIKIGENYKNDMNIVILS